MNANGRLSRDLLGIIKLYGTTYVIYVFIVVACMADHSHNLERRFSLTENDRGKIEQILILLQYVFNK